MPNLSGLAGLYTLNFSLPFQGQVPSSKLMSRSGEYTLINFSFKWVINGLTLNEGSDLSSFALSAMWKLLRILWKRTSDIFLGKKGVCTTSSWSQYSSIVRFITSPVVMKSERNSLISAAETGVQWCSLDFSFRLPSSIFFCAYLFVSSTNRFIM